LKKEYPAITVITLSRWFGEATALSVGFEKARGTSILTLASYFQVEPHQIHGLIQKFVADDQDLVIGWRSPRIDAFSNRVQSRSLSPARPHLDGQRVITTSLRTSQS
jgi:hypothetical protein